jgi:hypothetical protein
MEARKKLIIDPGKKTITRSKRDLPIGPVEIVGKFWGSKEEPTPVYLGELQTDNEGRLVFLGGNGRSFSINPDKHVPPHVAQDQPEIISEFDSIDWCDDVCDGWVDVSISHAGVGHLHRCAPYLFTDVHLLNLNYIGCNQNERQSFARQPNSPGEYTHLYPFMTFWKTNTGRLIKLMRVPTLHVISGPSYPQPILCRGLTTMHIKDTVCSFLDQYSSHDLIPLIGYGGKGYFAAMEEQLKKVPKPGEKDEYKELREHVFRRLRTPNYVNNDQASVIYMPRLSGNDGQGFIASHPFRI